MTTNSRRKFLATVGGAGVIALAGCLNGTPEGDAPESLPQPTYGEVSEDKPVLRIFEDYGCPYCADFEENVLPRLIEDYVNEGTLYLEYYDFLIPVRQMSKPAAASGRVVQHMAEDEITFWDYKRQVYANQDNLSYDLFEQVANELGLDGEEVVKQTRSGAWDKFVEENTQYGQQLGVSGTPSLFLNDTEIEPGSYSNITTQIELALQNSQ